MFDAPLDVFESSMQQVVRALMNAALMEPLLCLGMFKKLIISVANDVERANRLGEVNTVL